MQPGHRCVEGDRAQREHSAERHWTRRATVSGGGLRHRAEWTCGLPRTKREKGSASGAQRKGEACPSLAAKRSRQRPEAGRYGLSDNGPVRFCYAVPPGSSYTHGRERQEMGTEHRAAGVASTANGSAEPSGARSAAQRGTTEAQRRGWLASPGAARQQAEQRSCTEGSVATTRG